MSPDPTEKPRYEYRCTSCGQGARDNKKIVPARCWFCGHFMKRYDLHAINARLLKLMEGKAS